MKRIPLIILVISLTIFSSGCSGTEKAPVPGAYRMDSYLGMIKGKSVAVVANQTSLIGKTHLVDTLLRSGVNISVIFAPEHGFRNMADAGETIADGKDTITGIKIISLYGNHLKPSVEDLKGIDVVIFDIQDVGTRFYTYISTLHYVLEACAENKVKCLILDRPNPNGFYYDGNIPDTAYRSFVCIDPVPIVHGLTIGEYASMANGEGWLKNHVRCDLTVISCENYNHKTMYEVPVRPSPNLPNPTSIYLYPSICFFEGTNVSIGRGTPFPFQVYGSPELPDKGFSFTPESVPGATNPLFLGVRCYGVDLRNAIKDKLVPIPEVNLKWLIDAYNNYPEKDKFFNRYFDVLAGGPGLREQIQMGMNAREIRATWREGLIKYGRAREKYLLYK